ncbi:hypothetical protein H4S06_001734 [Coemansia sp. BCRC 34490]|nr:hypothetical protein LPJ72_004641 [Coemansia sp. Benny D160-2]KAJ2760426.1 hypothetical protein H4S06_001734 [Coemansia sp. BCRC 34490]
MTLLPANPTLENLTPEIVAKTIDHALLKPEMTVDEVIAGCKLCDKYGTASVCVKPCDVKVAAEALKDSDVDVGTVIGFPHGIAVTEVKVLEALRAIDDGAVELDMVINVGHLRSGRIDEVRDEIRSVTAAAKTRLPACCVKVILECSLLSADEIATASRLAEEAGADYVKTSTGFGPGGARVDDLRVMRQATNPDLVRVKASGGIRSLDDLIACLQAGADRIGTSATAAIIEDMRTRKSKN